MICRDAIRLESAAAQHELKLLESMQVGGTRRGVLLPALSVGVEWTLMTAKPGYWEFDGTFFGQPFYRLVIRTDAGLLTLEVQEAK